MNKLKFSKKGAMGNPIKWGVGIMILVQALIFVFGSDGLANANFTANAPSMLVAIFPLLIVAAVVTMVYKTR